MIDRRGFMIAGGAQGLLLPAAMAGASGSGRGIRHVPVSGLGPERIGAAEFQRRRQQVQTAMVRDEIDILLVPINENLTYLSNVASIAFGAYLLLPQVGEPALFVNPVSLWNEHRSPASSAYSGNELGESIRHTSMVADIRSVLPQDFGRAIARWCLDRGLSKKRIGVVGRDFDFPRGGGSLMGLTGPQSLNPATAADLRARLPGSEFIDASTILAEIRMRKSPAEILASRRATALADRCKTAILEELKRPRCRDADLFAAYWDMLMRGGGSSSWWFMTMICPSGAPEIQNFRDAPSDRAVRKGDVVFAEIMPAAADGFVGHSELCVVKGKLEQPARYDHVNRACIASFAAVRASLRPGVSIRDVVKAADEPILAAGLRRGAPVAYGLGMFGIEPPMMGLLDAPPGSPEPVLQLNMVLCVIAHVFDPVTQIAVRMGSTELITNAGRECLNVTAPTALSVL